MGFFSDTPIGDVAAMGIGSDYKEQHNFQPRYNKEKEYLYVCSKCGKRNIDIYPYKEKKNVS